MTDMRKSTRNYISFMFTIVLFMFQWIAPGSSLQKQVWPNPADHKSKTNEKT